MSLKNGLPASIEAEKATPGSVRDALLRSYKYILMTLYCYRLVTANPVVHQFKRFNLKSF
jgi:hypothetical protein